MTKLAIEGAVNTRAQIESELARVQPALALVEEAHQRVESEHGANREALALAGEACMKAEEECDCLTDERLSLVMELGAMKDEFAAFREKAIADREIMEAEFNSSGDALSITAMVVTFSRTTFVGASLISRMECRILQSRSPQNYSPTPDAPQASRHPLQPWIQLRSIQRLARLLSEKRIFFRWISRLNRIPLLSSVKCSVEAGPVLINVFIPNNFPFFPLFVNFGYSLMLYYLSLL